MSKPELIAPAGNWDCARAAVANGANAVYFGLQKFNARMRAANFTEEELPELVRFLHEHGVRAYCTLNVLVFTDELPAAERELILLDEAGVDAVMVQDLGVAVLARELGLRLEAHGSTQMTITSPEGVKFAARLGIKRVVLARETSLRELARFAAVNGQVGAPTSLSGRPGETQNRGGDAAPTSTDPAVELEMFVHGALCVAYSGQCLTSEALGQRSANRGECAQACRLPYELIVDGAVKELGDRRYLLSPQDLAAVKEIPELIRLGVTGFKIEGRLKTPEYVAATCQVYRKALDAALNGADCSRRREEADSLLTSGATDADRYKLEMTFSRGLYPGWMHGVNHQELVHARFGKKRGPLLGAIEAIGRDQVVVGAPFRARPGDGIVFDTGGDPDNEQGGRIWEIRGNQLCFERGHIDFAKLKPGDRIWKTSDPQLERELRRTFQGDIPRPKRRLDLRVSGAVGEPLVLECGDLSPLSADKQSADKSAHSKEATIRVASRMPLQTAFRRPLTEKLLREQLGRLGETDFVLGDLDNRLVGQVILPVSELNRLRRELVDKFRGESDTPVATGQGTKSRQECRSHQIFSRPSLHHSGTPSLQLIVLCRTMDQIRASLETGCETLYVDFEDIRRYPEAVALARASRATIFLATPRIQKAGEPAFFKTIEQAQPDGVLIRNLGALDYFRASPLRKVGDFSLNVANPLTADLLIREGLERLTISYDLNAQQVLDLLRAAPPQWFELVVHQHMPMFHMEHCVIAAFLSNGTDHTNCGRPCDRHNLKLRDRVGVEHPVKADVGCRNTVFHARAQSGAPYLREFLAAGARVFRVELLEEDAAQTRQVLAGYRELLNGSGRDPAELVRRLKAVDQLGVTSGTLTVLG